MQSVMQQVKQHFTQITLLADFYLLSIQMVANWMVWTTIKNSVTKCHLATKIFTLRIANFKFDIHPAVVAWR